MTNTQDAGTVHRVVMVGTACWKWEFDSASYTHLEEVLTGLTSEYRMRFAASGFTEAPEGGITEIELSRYALYESKPRPAPRWSGPDRDSTAAIADLIAKLDDTAEAKGGSRYRLEGPPSVRQFRIRLVADREAIARLSSSAHGPEAMCIDVAIRQAEIEELPRFYCVASASFFSDTPYSPWHGAAPERHPRYHTTALEPWAREVYEEIWPHLRTLLGPPDEYHRVIHDVGESLYDTPVFWIIALDKDGDSAGRQATRFLLQAEDTSPEVARCSVGDDLSIARRLCPLPAAAGGSAPEPHLHIPVYVLATTMHIAASDAWVVDTRPLESAEEDLADRVLALTTIELELAARLFDVDSDLTMDANFAEVYAVTAEYGAVLWDALAKHLPTERTGDEAEEAIQIIHQTILQGVADVDVLATEVDDLDQALARDLRKIERAAAAELGDRSAVTRQVVEAGPAAEVRARATEMAARVTRIRNSVTWLRDAITAAFDERRVRTVDKAGTAGYALAIAGATFGFGTLTDLLVEYKIPLTPPTSSLAVVIVWSLRIATVMAIVVLLVVLLRQVVLYNRRARLGSAQFQERFKQVRDYLERVSTHELRKTLERTHPTDHPPRQPCPRCRKLDGVLSRELRDNWAMAMPPTARTWRAASTVKDLRAEAEIWAVQSMLLTERTRTLFKYWLPQLAALYYALSSTDNLLARPLFTARPARAIADPDVLWCLRYAGFRREEARVVLDWLATLGDDASASAIYERVASLQLTYYMSDGARTAALTVAQSKA